MKKEQADLVVQENKMNNIVTDIDGTLVPCEKIDSWAELPTDLEEDQDSNITKGIFVVGDKPYIHANFSVLSTQMEEFYNAKSKRHEELIELLTSGHIKFRSI